MVFINETTFEMWDFAGAQCQDAKDGWFSVDEVIAPAIQVLNQRGYRTEYCCSGHPIHGLVPIYYANEDGDVGGFCGYTESLSPSLYVAFDRDYGMGLGLFIPRGFYSCNRSCIHTVCLGLSKAEAFPVKIGMQGVNDNAVQAIVQKKPKNVVAVVSCSLKPYLYFLGLPGTGMDLLQQTFKAGSVVGNGKHFGKNFAF